MRIAEAAKKIGVSRQSLINWEHKGYIRCYKNATGQRHYTEKDIRDILVAMNMSRKAMTVQRLSTPDGPDRRQPYIKQTVDWNRVRSFNSHDFIVWRRTEGKHIDHTEFPDDLNKLRFVADRGLDDFVWTPNPGDEGRPRPPILLPQQLDALAEQRKREAQGLA